MEEHHFVTKGNLTINDFKRVCRTCLSTVGLQQISCGFNTGYFPVEIALNKYTQIQFDPLDNLPKQICSNCIRTLNRSYNFLLNCDLVNTTLKECLARHESSLQTNDCLPNEMEYVNCHIKEERETNEYSMLLMEEAPYNVEDENDSDNYDSDGESIITNVKHNRKETCKRTLERVEIKRERDDADMIASNNNLLPEKSRERYEIVYRKFMDWRHKNKVESFSEDVLLEYFHELSKTMKPSTLWAIYCMLKTTIGINHDCINIATYPKLNALLKKKSRGFKSKKSKTLDTKEIQDFLQNAPDSKYLFMKVVVIMGISGACTRQQLRNVYPEHVEDTGKSLIIRIPESNTIRCFVVSGEFYPTCKKYMNLRPLGENSKSLPFFLNYVNEKCTKQCVGVNKLGSITKEIAEYLGLPDAKQYTSHCFRRSSANILTDPGAE